MAPAATAVTVMTVVVAMMLVVVVVRVVASQYLSVVVLNMALAASQPLQARARSQLGSDRVLVDIATRCLPTTRTSSLVFLSLCFAVAVLGEA